MPRLVPQLYYYSIEFKISWCFIQRLNYVADFQLSYLYYLCGSIFGLFKRLGILVEAEQSGWPAERILASEAHSAFTAWGLWGADDICVVHRALLLASSITHVTDYFII